jgi:drug/metabolite transporter (DMT)-like permease
MSQSALSPAPVRASTDTLALVVLVLGAATIAFAGILVRLTETGPAAGGFWRLALAVPFLFLLQLGVAPPPRSARRGRRLALLAGLLFAGDLACWHYGLMLTSVANATVLSNLAPIVVALAAWIFLRDAPRPIFALGLVIGVAGAGCMALFADHAARPSSLAGDALGAATAVWYGAYLLVVNAARRTLPAATIMLFSSAAGAPVMLAVALLLGEQIIPATASGWLACLGLAAIHVVGQGAIAWALGRIAAPVAAVTLLVQPVVAAAAGLVLFGETLTPLQLLGAGLALTGVCIARLAAAPRAAPAA